ncbi:MAG: DUF1232 domain-containing protein [Fimbriimonadaceae bacterium]|nr:DUF1232 domain-containing protein [Fimbriimonadaceae bacterium]
MRGLRLRAGLWLLAGAIYLVSPLDLVPDLAPFIGWIDDALVVIVALQRAFSALRGLRRRAADGPVRGSPATR